MSPGSTMFFISCALSAETPGEAVGLQLDPNLQSMALCLAHTLPRGLDLIHDPEQLLHVVSDSLPQ